MNNKESFSRYGFKAEAMSIGDTGWNFTGPGQIKVSSTETGEVYGYDYDGDGEIGDDERYVEIGGFTKGDKLNAFNKWLKDNAVDFDDIIEQINTDTSNIINTKPSKNEFNLETLLHDTDDSIFKSKGIIKTGLNTLDSVIHGMTRGEITIVAGRPANGKTTVAANIARQLVLSGKRVMMFNREMPNTEMMKKFIAMESMSLSYRNLRHGATSSPTEVHTAMQFIKENYQDKLFMYDSVSDLQSTFEEIKRIKPDVVIDDHIGLIEFPSRDTRDLRHKIRETTMKYKWLAKAHDMCVILVSQLNRNIEHRIDATPRLSDLAESGSLEQDAEMVVFTHYPYVSRFGQADSDGRVWGKNEMMLIVSKNRYGTPGSVEMGYSGDSCLLFDDIRSAKDYEEKKRELDAQ